VKFTKMQGLGNDFVVVETSEALDAETVRSLADRRRGVGADGVLTITSDLRMGYWNGDGTAAEMCGNGLRCLARHAVGRGWAQAGEWFSIQTRVGPRLARVGEEDVTVEVGVVEIGEPVELSGHRFTTASIGNPHAVARVDDPDGVDVETVGRAVGTASVFPSGSNVEFVAPTAPDRIRLRVWERGVGETLACGSGMVVAAAVVAGTGHATTVDVPGGSATVHFEDGSGYLTGPAETVFEGTWPNP
jgi:diaminopimelate epimerase